MKAAVGVAGIGSASFAALHFLFGIDQLRTMLFGDPAADILTMVVILAGVLALIGGLLNGKLGVAVVGLVLIVFAPQVAGFLWTLKRGNLGGSNLGGDGETGYGEPPAKPYKPYIIPRNINGTTRLEGGGETSQDLWSPLGLAVMILYKNSSEWRVIPKLQSTLLDFDVIGGPKPVHEIRFYLRVLDQGLDVKEFHVNLEVYIDDKLAFFIKNKTIKTAFSTKQVKEIYIGEVKADALAEFVTKNESIMRIRAWGWVPNWPIGQRNFRADLKFKVGYSSANTELQVPTAPEEYYGSIVLGSVLTDIKNSVDWSFVYLILQIAYIVTAIFVMLKGR